MNTARRAMTSFTRERDGRRAADRGRTASRPAQIPMRGWKDVLVRVWKELNRDNLSIVAGGVAFYALLALFPAIGATVMVYGLATQSAEVEQQLAPLREFIPDDAYDIVREQTISVASQADGTLSVGVIFTLGLSVWSATKGIKALFTALNIAYEEQEKRGFFRLNLIALALTLGAILLTIVALAIIAAVPAAVAIVGEGGLWDTVLLATRWIVMALLMMVALALVFRYGPSRASPQMRWVSPGAVAATVLWLASSVAFSFYVRNFGNYGETFGSLGAVVVLLMWFYISAYVVCLGAELNAELELQTERDTTTGPEKPMGERGAYVADATPPG